MTHLYRDVEMPLTEILCEMERDGIRCDEKVLDAISDKTQAQID